MRPPKSSPRRSVTNALIALVIAACGPVAAEADIPAENPESNSPIQGPPGLAVVPVGGTALYQGVNGPLAQTALERLVLPILDSSVPGWHQVLTTCGWEAWVRDDSVVVFGQADPPPAGTGFDLSRAVVVVDPGHGGRDLGGPGATDAWESHVNLDIAARLRILLESSNSIDWATGAVSAGEGYPAVGRVWMTRTPEGPEAGDIELSLAYRAEMANRSGADALVSIHNNTGPEITTPLPGSEVYYSVGSPGSDRLASLIHEELIRSMSPLADEWASGRVSGPKTRVNPDTSEDFYGLLRRTEAPSVIVEGLYISAPNEEAILTSSVGQQAYAEAVYRGLIRFLTTEESGSEVNPPEPFTSNVGSSSYSSCEVPEQPGL